MKNLIMSYSKSNSFTNEETGETGTTYRCHVQGRSLWIHPADHGGNVTLDEKAKTVTVKDTDLCEIKPSVNDNGEFIKLLPKLDVFSAATI